MFALKEAILLLLTQRVIEMLRLIVLHKKKQNKEIARMKSVVSILLSFLALANAIELTPDNFDEAVAGKTVFIKFLAPW